MVLGLVSLYHGGRVGPSITTLRHCVGWVPVDVQWAKWSKNLCRMSIQPLLDLFSDSTETNTAAIYHTLNDYTSKEFHQESGDPHSALTFQFEAFRLATNLFNLHAKSPQSTEASRAAWADHLIERYLGTAALLSGLSPRRRSEGFDKELGRAVPQFNLKNILAAIAVGKGNFSKPHG